ncbi:MAG: hypothetical protein R2796_04955 [Chitinophagaceae bacterium]|nr:hypothetical protein [Chitinophagaceae bacterium]MCB0740064.1 hypothetical protein [Chitinophagaceae bacterium]
MATLRFIAYLFYRYYSTGPRKEIAYLSSMLAMCLLFYIHLFQVLILVDSTSIIPTGSKSEISTWVKLALFLLPIYLLFRWLIKESDLKALIYDKEKLRKGNIWLVIYIIISVTLLVLLILYKKGKL